MYEALNQWDFVVAAYAVGIAGTLGMVAELLTQQVQIHGG